MTDWARVRARLTRDDFRRSRILLGLDFDGTLADIVDAPEAAALAPVTRSLLRALSLRRDMRVAVLSGRALDDIQGRVGLDGLYYAGDHGLQLRGPDMDWTHPRAGELDGSVWHPLTEDLKDIPGAIIERKRLGVAVHYRKVPLRYVRRLADRVKARLLGVRNRYRILRGNKTFDIRSTVPWNKGHALEAIRSRLAGGWRGIFIGDDRTDEEGFVTLGPRALTIRVGRVRSTAAQFVFSHRGQVDRLLEVLRARPSPTGG